MPEGANVEIAHRLTEQEHHQHDDTRARGWHRFVEFGEVAILAIVAVATAWSGFQATEWDGEQSLRYGQASTDRFEAEMTRRFTADYRTAFDAWLALDPFANPAAPPGPAAMPEYHNAHRAEAERLNARASERFDVGTDARDTGGKYVRATVLFASVLFLVAVGQRFKAPAARLAANGIAALVLIYTVVSVADLPRV